MVKKIVGLFSRLLPSRIVCWLKCKVLSIVNAKNPGCYEGFIYDEYPWLDDVVKNKENLTFSHSGGLGDILFALHFMREFSEHNGIGKYNFHFLVKEKDYPVAEFIIPLLKAQSGVDKVTIGRKIPDNTNEIALHNFWKLKLNFAASDIRSWYYNLTRCHLPREFWKPVIEVDADYKYRNKILICNTDRYCNVHVDLNYLKEFQRHLVFIGLPHEHEAFCRNFFEVPYQPCKDMLEMAQYMAGAKGFIGNQSGIYSLAECMKIPRILLAPEFVRFNSVIIPGPHNNHPIGGWCEDVVSTEKMIAAVKALLNKE